MKSFHYFEPSTLEEVLDLLHQYRERAKVLAGGTDLVVQMKQKKANPEVIINLSRLQELNFVQVDSEIRMGPLTPLSRIATHPAFSGRLALLREAALAVADVQIRNVATLGGNIANASPSADMPPALLTLGAKVKLRKKDRERIVGLDEFCVGPFCTHLEGEELIVEIAISPIPEGSGAYVWVPKRTTVDETLVGVSVWLLADPVQKTCLGAAVALSSVAPVPLRCKKTESFLQGKILNRETFRQAGEVAAEILEANPQDLVIEAGKVMVRGVPEKAIPITELPLGEAFYVGAKGRGRGRPVLGRGSFTVEDATPLDRETGQGKNPSAFWMYATQAAEVEVDPRSGRVKVLRISSAHDVGKSIHPVAIEGQIQGALVMGVGTALFEEMELEKGRVKNPSFAEYKLPSALDAPEMIPIIVEELHAQGPYGAKGLGEPALAPTAAAIANAIYAAVGVRVKDLPITPEKILEGLRKKENR